LAELPLRKQLLDPQHIEYRSAFMCRAPGDIVEPGPIRRVPLPVSLCDVEADGHGSATELVDESCVSSRERSEDLLCQRKELDRTSPAMRSRPTATVPRTASRKRPAPRRENSSLCGSPTTAAVTGSPRCRTKSTTQTRASARPSWGQASVPGAQTGSASYGRPLAPVRTIAELATPLCPGNWSRIPTEGP